MSATPLSPVREKIGEFFLGRHLDPATFCEKYTGSDVLATSLNTFNKKKKLHPQLIEAFKNLYSYSSQKNTGSRHGWAVEDDTFVPTFYEARFMLVASSAFINYIKGKFSENLEEQ